MPNRDAKILNTELLNITHSIELKTEERNILE